MSVYLCRRQRFNRQQPDATMLLEESCNFVRIVADLQRVDVFAELQTGHRETAASRQKETRHRAK
jgi:hypothetical protein